MQGYLVQLGNDARLTSDDKIVGPTQTFASASTIGTGSWTWSGTYNGTTYTNTVEPGTYYLATDGNVYFVSNYGKVDTLTNGTASTPATFDDREFGTAGNDTGILGGAEQDVVYGGTGTGTTGTGNDTIRSGAGNDTIYGGDGTDTIIASGGADTIFGGTGNDTIYGDNDTAVVATTEHLSWIAQGASGTNIINGFTQDTGNMRVTVNFNNDGRNTGVTTNNTAQYVGGGPFATNSSAYLTGNGGGANVTASIKFDAEEGTGLTDTVSNVSFRINDVDISNWQDIITVRAYDWNGNAVAVTLTAGDPVNDVVNGQTVTSTGGGNNTASDLAGSVLVSIAGPVHSIQVIYSNGGNSGQALWLTDVYYSTVPDPDGADSIQGDAGDDLIYGGGAADIIDGNDGNDTIYGGTGDDTIADTGTGTDTIYGDAGNDIITSGSENDLVYGGDDQDSIAGGTGDDRLYGDAGNDTVVGDAGNDQLYGGTGNDALFGGADNDLLAGGAGNDTLLGGTGNDTLSGDAGDDTLSGEDGNDTLLGGQGSDTIYGGAGVDTIKGDTIAFDPSAFASGGGTASTLTVINSADAAIELWWIDGSGVPVYYQTAQAGATITQGTFSGHNWVLRDTAGNYLEAIAGAATQTVTFGAQTSDTIQGGDGNDVIQGQFGNDSIAGDAGSDTLFGGSGNDALYGGADNDSLSGDAGSDSVYGGAGADSISGGAGNDLIYGGDNDDIIGAWNLDESGDDTMFGDAGNDSIVGGAGNDTVYGGTGDDTLSGQGGNDTVYGGDGQDTFVVTEDHNGDIIYGGEGGVDNDILSLGSYLATDGVTVTLTGTEAGSYAYKAQPGNGTFSEIERITTTGLNDTVNGAAATGALNISSGAGNDSVIGGSGNDTIALGTGADTVRGGAGNDTINLGTTTPDGAADLIVFSSGHGQDTVTNFDAPTPNGDGTYTGIDKLNVAALLDAGGQPVRTNDVTVGNDGSGNVTLTFPNGERLTLIGVTPAQLSSPYALNAIGIPLPDGTVSGTSGNDLIDINYTGDPDGDRVDANDAILPGMVGNDDLIEAGAGNDTVLAGEGNDTVFGGIGNDTIFGGAGDDSIDGGTGNDVLYGGDGNDIISEGFNAMGDVTIYGGAGDDYIETGTGGADTDVYGGDGNDFIVDNGDADSNDLLDGGAGNDDILGGEGNDTIIGGDGDDFVNGASGDDTFILGNGFGIDFITGGEFSEVTGDVLDATSMTDDVTLDFSAASGGGPFGTGVLLTSGLNSADITEVEQFNLGSGNDTVIGSNLGDHVNMGGGNDTFVLTDYFGNDIIVGGETGETTGDSIDGSTLTTGVSVTFSGAEAGTISDGTDTANFSEIEQITTGAGNDTVFGGAGNDNVATGGGGDTLFGGGGNDTLFAGAGADTVDGGSGDDTIDLGDNGLGAPDGDSDLLILTNSSGQDIIHNFDAPVPGGGGTYTGIDMLDVSALLDLGGNPVDTGDVTVTDTVGDGSGDVILQFAGGQSITLIGLSPSQFSSPQALVAIGIPLAISDGTIEGTGGDDVIDGAYVNDPDGDRVDNNDAHLPGDTGNDDLIYAYGGNDTVVAGDGNDEVYGGTGGDTLYGGDGDDTLFGDDGNDTLFGGIGADTLSGDLGNDTITAAKDDSVAGGAGDDTIIITNLGEGGGGTITVDGGSGDEVAGDTLDLTGILVKGSLTKTDDGTGSFSGSALLTDGSTINFSEIENIICFTPGTLIATPQGARDIASLRKGDMVVTRDHGLQPIRWIQSRTVPALDRFAPIRIRPGVVTGLERSILVSPQHRMLFQGYRAELLFGESEVLVSALHLVDGKDVTIETGGTVTYIHMMFDEHEIVYAEGSATESFHPGDVGLSAVTDEARAELFDLFPALRSDVSGYGMTARRCLKKHEAMLLSC